MKLLSKYSTNERSTKKNSDLYHLPVDNDRFRSNWLYSLSCCLKTKCQHCISID